MPTLSFRLRGNSDAALTTKREQRELGTLVPQVVNDNKPPQWAISKHKTERREQHLQWCGGDTMTIGG